MGLSIVRSFPGVLSVASLLFGLTPVVGAAASDQSPPQKGIDLAIAGHCPEAMPLLDQTMRDAGMSDDIKRSTSTAGVRCSMLLNQQEDAMSFLAWLQQKYPNDPEVLFLAVHVFSELSQRNSRELMRIAPDSPLVIQLNAENFERQGDVARAIAEYRILLQRSPDREGVHYRIAGLLMSSQTKLAEAKKEFAEELRINPQNASAEFYLGELNMQENDAQQAIKHYLRATELYPGFPEAFARLGRALLDSGDSARAVSPLEKAVKLAPDDPAVHLSLATAYQRSGRKADAARELDLQRITSEAINRNVMKTLRKNVSGVLS